MTVDPKVADLLAPLGFQEYLTGFTESGFDVMEAILRMDWSRMDAVGFFVCHKRRLAPKLKELRNS